MEEFRRIKRELVAKGAIIDYYQDTMQIPNGNIAKWDLICLLYTSDAADD